MQRQTLRRAVAAMLLRGHVSIARRPGELRVRVTSEARASADWAVELATEADRSTGPRSPWDRSWCSPNFSR